MEDKTFSDENLEILDILLCDRTTKKNIVWATNNYEKRGYKEQDNIKSNIKKQGFIKQLSIIKTPIRRCTLRNFVIIMKITDSEGLGNIIRNRRKELKYTQAFLSEYTGLSVSFISDVERGKPTVEIGKVIQLISILGLDINIDVRGR